MEERDRPLGFSRASGWFIFAMLFANAFLPLSTVTALSALFLLFCLTASGFNIPRSLVGYLVIPSMLIAIGVAGSIGNLPYDVLKDGWYYLNPVLVLSAGYLAMHRMRRVEPMLRVFVIGGFALAVYHVIGILSNPSMLFETSVQEIREGQGAGYFLTMLSLAAALFAGRSGLKIFESRHSKVFLPAIVIVDAASVFLSFSRTMWVSFIIISLAASGLFTLRRLKFMFVAGAISLGLLLLAVNVFKGRFEDATMAGKLVNSLDEVLIRDYLSNEDIQKHWRGYESYMAMQTYLDGGAVNLMAGHGFGKLVDLNIHMILGGEDHRFIPVLHNGYMYALVKTGAAGLLLYILYLFRFLKAGLRHEESKDKGAAFAGRFIVGFSLVLFFSTFVIAGLFNKSALIPVVLLLGAFLSYVRMRAAAENRRKAEA